MYGVNPQNPLIKLRAELNECCYEQRMKDYLADVILRIMNFPKKTSEGRHFTKAISEGKIMMIWYPMSVPFLNRNYSVPLIIYIMRNFPYDAPQFFLEIAQGSEVNSKNTDINPYTKRIMTNTLRQWNYYSNVESVLNEIFQSFSRIFPLYKKSNNPQNPPPVNYNQRSSGGGGIYGMMQNEVNNLYQQNTPNDTRAGIYGFQPKTKSIYGRSMTLNVNNDRPKSFGGGIYENNNNDQQPQSFGGGIYGNNNNNNEQPKSFGGGIYKDSNNNYQRQNTFGGAIYKDLNNNNQKPNSFGGGIYDNNNNNQNNRLGGGIYDYNNNNQGGIYSNNQNRNQNNQDVYNAPPPIQSAINHDEEFKKILVDEVCGKISNKLIEEKKRLYTQNDKMNTFKGKLSIENNGLQNFLNRQNEIKEKCEEDMNNLNIAIKKIEDYNNNNRTMVINEENCLNYLEIPDQNALKIIANETCLEEMILIVKKGFEKKKISFDEAINFMRNSTRDIFAIRFLKDKIVNKYKC